MEPKQTDWETETLELLRDAQVEAARFTQRLAQVQQQAASAQQRLESIQATLDLYRAKHGRPTLQAADLDMIAVEYQELNPKQIVQKWADAHDSMVVMTEMTSTLAAAGLFVAKRTADGVLYPVVRRGNMYEKVRRGVYRKRPPVGMNDMEPHRGTTTERQLRALPVADRDAATAKSAAAAVNTAALRPSPALVWNDDEDGEENDAEPSSSDSKAEFVDGPAIAAGGGRF